MSEELKDQINYSAPNTKVVTVTANNSLLKDSDPLENPEDGGEWGW